VKPETRNRRLEPTGLAKPVETRGLTGTGPGLARQESPGRVFGSVWNRTDPFLRSKPGPLAGYPDPLLTLLWYYTDSDLGGEAATSKSTSGIVIYALRAHVFWTLKKQCLVARSMMLVEMIAPAYTKVESDWLRGLISEIRIGSSITRHMLKDGRAALQLSTWAASNLIAGTYDSSTTQFMKLLPQARLRSSMWQAWSCWQMLSLKPLGELNSANLRRTFNSDRITGRI